MLERRLLHAGREEHVLAAVAGDAQFRQAENADAGLAGGRHRGPNVPLIRFPSHRRCVHGSGGEAKTNQGWAFRGEISFEQGSGQPSVAISRREMNSAGFLMAANQQSKRRKSMVG